MLRQGMKLISGFTIKFFDDEKIRIKAAAEKNHLATIPWIRQLVLKAVEETEKDDAS
jgi:hypothetical protein